ncbi:MAG: peptide ABC transporter substrate-binding protein [Dehalococcoidia bacterium]|nr:MAG: peptide ABC transporter substrate-binding protein [Chloroflexota bacterium]
MISKIKLSFFSLLLVAIFSCGSDSAVSETESIGKNSNVAPGLANSSESESSAKRDNIFRLNFSDPPTFDPALVTDTTSASIIVEIFSGLVTLNKDLEIIPDLAESWDISDDGKKYTFNLREGIKFSNGDPVKASDFKWAIERASNPDTGSLNAEVYLGDIVGVKEVIESGGSLTEVSGLKAIDDNTLEITIDEPKTYFLAKLTYPTAFVLSKDYIEKQGEDWIDNPVGTGPFILSEYQIGQTLKLKKNENYWAEKAKVDGIIMNLAGGVSMAMYENDEIDITGVGLADLERVKDPNDSLSKDLVNVPPQFSLNYIGFNVNMPPFDDVNFRKALSYAVDKEIIAEKIYSGLTKPSYSIIPPGFPGYSPSIKGIEFNEELAKEYLAKSKYSDPSTRPRIIVTIPGTGGSPGLDTEVISDMWKETLGIEVEIQQVEWATYLQDMNRKRLQLWAGSGWQADYADPQDFIDVLFYSKSDVNHGNYSNPEVDKLILEARTEVDNNRRFLLYNQAEQMIVDEAAIFPLWFDTDGYALVKPWVKGYEFTPIIVPKFKDVEIK